MARWALILFVTGTLLVYVTTAFVADFDEVTRPVTQVGGGIWLAVLTLSLINYILRFGRWHLYLRSFGHRVPPGRHLSIYIAGFALTPTPGKLGEGIRALYLKPFGINVGRSVSTLYAERVLDIVSVSILAALLCLAPVSGFRWLAIVGGAIAIGLILAQHPAILNAIKKPVGRSPYGWLKIALERVTSFQRDVTSLVRGQLLLLGLILGLVAWAAEGFGLYLVADALDVDLTPWAALGIYATAMLAGALSFVPGGLGSAEATMVALLALTGVPVSTAIAITMVVRVVTLWFAVALGLIAWLGLEASRHAVPATGIGEDRN